MHTPSLKLASIQKQYSSYSSDLYLYLFRTHCLFSPNNVFVLSYTLSVNTGMQIANRIEFFLNSVLQNYLTLLNVIRFVSIFITKQYALQVN